MIHDNSLNWVMYEYYFSFPREKREAILKEQHEKTTEMLRSVLSPFITDKESLDMLIPHEPSLVSASMKFLRIFAIISHLFHSSPL